MTPIDSIYKFAGMKFAGIFHDSMSGLWIPAIIALSGLAFVVHTVADHGEPKRIVIHVLYLFVMGWLISPMDATLPSAADRILMETQGRPMASTLRVPRFVYYLTQACDTIQRRTVTGINPTFLDGPFRFERIAAGASSSRIFDEELAKDVQEFYKYCTHRVILGRHMRKAAVPDSLAQNPLNSFEDYASHQHVGPRALDKRKGENALFCEEHRADLAKRVRKHIEKHPHHKDILATAQRHDPHNHHQFREQYFNQTVLNTLFASSTPGNDDFIRDTLGNHAHFSLPNPGAAHTDEGALERLKRVATEFLDMIGSTSAVLSQWWSDQFSARQKYYVVATQAPYVYGFSLMLLIAFFPLAGMWALLPGKWTVLVNYAKVFVSINLWPIGWALLSSFTANQSSTQAFNPASFGEMDLWMAVVSMYVATPVFCFGVVSLLSMAGGHAFVSFRPDTAGPGAGPLGALASVVTRGAGRSGK